MGVLEEVLPGAEEVEVLEPEEWLELDDETLLVLVGVEVPGKHWL